MVNKTLIRIQTLFMVSLITVGPSLAIPVTIVGAAVIAYLLLEKPELAKVYDLAEYRAKRQVVQVAIRKAA